HTGDVIGLEAIPGRVDDPRHPSSQHFESVEGREPSQSSPRPHPPFAGGRLEEDPLRTPSGIPSGSVLRQRETDGMEPPAIEPVDDDRAFRFDDDAQIPRPVLEDRANPAVREAILLAEGSQTIVLDL